MTTTAPDVSKMDQSERERILTDRRLHAELQDWKRKHPAKRGLSEREREEALVIGLERTAKRLRREGEEKRADDCERLLTTAREHLQAAALARAEWEQHAHPAAIIAAAVEPLARKLAKAMGADESDAVQFVAQNWPLSEARREAGAAADAMGKLSRQANDATREFWRAVEAAGRVAFSRNADATNIRELLALGVM